MFALLIYIIKVWLLGGIIDVIILKWKFDTRITVSIAIVAIFCWPYVAYKTLKHARK